MDPIHQFQIKNILTFGRIGGVELALTNSALYMLLALAADRTAHARRHRLAGRWCPGRMQSIAEMSYEFVATTLRSTAGTEGMKFFPFVFTIFMFVLTVNLIGLIPYAFSVTSHIIITSCAGAAGIPHRHRSRLLEERAALLQAVRTERDSDLHPAAGGVHRGAVVPVAPGIP